MDIRGGQRSQLEAAIGGGLNHDAKFAGKDFAVNGRSYVAFTTGVERDFRELEFFEGLATRGLEPNTEGGLRTKFWRKIKRLKIAGGKIARFHDAQRKQLYVVGGLEDAGGLFAFAKVAFESGAAGNGDKTACIFQT